MKLYYQPSACSMSPHIVLREAGVDFEISRVKRKTKVAEDGVSLLDLNPMGMVPTLKVSDELTLTEGPAIVQYIADQAPDKNLMPKHGTVERYKAQQWLNWVSTELHKGFAPLFTRELSDETKAFAKTQLHKRFAILDKHLEQNDYVLGSEFSVVDAYAFTVISWSQYVDLDLGDYGNIGGYLGRVAARPAVQETMRAEGILKE